MTDTGEATPTRPVTMMEIQALADEAGHAYDVKKIIPRRPAHRGRYDGLADSIRAASHRPTEPRHRA